LVTPPKAIAQVLRRAFGGSRRLIVTRNGELETMIDLDVNPDPYGSYVEDRHHRIPAHDSGVLVDGAPEIRPRPSDRKA